MSVWERKLSRRRFVQTAAVATGAVLVSPLLVQEQAAAIVLPEEPRIWALGGVTGFNDQGRGDRVTRVRIDEISPPFTPFPAVFVPGGVESDVSQVRPIWLNYHRDQLVVENPNHGLRQGDTIVLVGNSAEQNRYRVTEVSENDVFWLGVEKVVSIKTREETYYHG